MQFFGTHKSFVLICQNIFKSDFTFDFISNSNNCKVKEEIKHLALSEVSYVFVSDPPALILLFFTWTRRWENYCSSIYFAHLFEVLHCRRLWRLVAEVTARPRVTASDTMNI